MRHFSSITLYVLEKTHSLLVEKRDAHIIQLKGTVVFYLMWQYQCEFIRLLYMYTHTCIHIHVFSSSPNPSFCEQLGPSKTGIPVKQGWV